MKEALPKIVLIDNLNTIIKNLSRAKSQAELETLMFDSFSLFIKDSFEVIFWRYDSMEQVLEPIMLNGIIKKDRESIIKNDSPELFNTALLQRNTLSIPDCSKERRLKDTLFNKNGSMVIIPGYCGDGTVALITLFVSKKNYFQHELETILSLITNLLSSVYEGLKIQKTHYNKLEDYIHNEAFNKSVVEYGSDIIIILDTKGEILYHNPSSEETLGYFPGFLVGKNFLEFVHPKDLKNFKDSFDQSLKDKKTLKLEYQFLCANGKYKYLESNSINLMDKEGVDGLILDSRDITQKIKTNNELKEQKQFIQQVIDTDPNLIYVKNWDGKFLLVNQAVADLHGSSKENVIKTLNKKTKSKTEELYNESKEDTKAILNGEEIIVEEFFTTPDNSVKWFQTTKKALPGEDGKPKILNISVDITQRKKDAEELLSAQKAKEQFLANMSHEIRTPINGIAGLINLLVETNPTEEQKKYLNGIQNSSENLKVIINDILDISKIESGKLKFEEIGFLPENQIVSVIETFRYRTDEKGLQLIHDIDSEARNVLLGDPVRLNQILMNLIGNAVKFTYAGHIKVHAGIERDEGDKVIMKFSVSDTGIGIQSDKIEAIFDSFRQADESVTRKFGGTGLGLAICKQLVELQNGEISVQSIEREGTTFSFTIPYKKAKDKDLQRLNPNQNPTRINEMGTFHDLSILLVEDNDINQMYSSNILKKWNCKVDIAANGYIALEKIRKNTYDLVLMDIQMPVMDGFEATRNIRNNFSSPKSNVPIIALTANAIKGDSEKCFELGINDYLSKPFVPEELFEKIVKLTGAKYDLNNKKNKTTHKKEVLNAQKKGNATPVTDLSYLKHVSENNDEFVNEMIGSFLQNNPLMIEQLKKEATSQNWKEVGKIAHKVKPSIAFMGINSMKSVVEAIETNGLNSNNLSDMGDLIKQLENTCILAYKELEQEQRILHKS